MEMHDLVLPPSAPVLIVHRIWWPELRRTIGDSSTTRSRHCGPNSSPYRAVAIIGRSGPAVLDTSRVDRVQAHVRFGIQPGRDDHCRKQRSLRVHHRGTGCPIAIYRHRGRWCLGSNVGWGGGACCIPNVSLVCRVSHRCHPVQQ